MELDSSYTLQETVDAPRSLTGYLPNQTQAIDNLVKCVTDKFIEYVIVADNNCILVTEAKVYISNNTAYNAVAYLTPSTETHNLNVKLKPNIKFSANWEELIIQYGIFQVLVRGLIYDNDSKVISCSLGSSVKLNFGIDPKAALMYNRQTRSQLIIPKVALVDLLLSAASASNSWNLRHVHRLTIVISQTSEITKYPVSLKSRQNYYAPMFQRRQQRLMLKVFFVNC